ncbi:MAG: protoheme IX farnesyltransferase, partial [Elusimicrobiota bacterium]
MVFQRSGLTLFTELIRFKISLISTVSAICVFILAAHHIPAMIVPLFLSVFLLSAGASALNQCQEKDLDALMTRTKDRPLPSGRLSLPAALAISAGLIICALYMLALYAGTLPAALGAVALLWYNGVYTYLKRVSAYAAIPGSAIGGLSGAIGWSAAGGGLDDPRFIAVAIFLCLWQIPHFWLLGLLFADDHRRAALPTPSQTLSDRQLALISYVWIIATALTAMLLALYRVISSAAGLLLLGA